MLCSLRLISKRTDHIAESQQTPIYINTCKKERTFWAKNLNYFLELKNLLLQIKKETL